MRTTISLIIKYFSFIVTIIFFQQLIYGLNLEINSIAGSSNCVGKLNDKIYPCVLGKKSVTKDKKEGDKSTPYGEFPVRKVFFRADRIGNKLEHLKIPTQIINKDDGWCDDSLSPEYNKYVKLPFQYSHEKLWREDHLYDIILVIGYNDQPVVSEKGSAIFLHIKSPETKSTAGCVAFSEKNLIEILHKLDLNSKIIIK